MVAIGQRKTGVRHGFDKQDNHGGAMPAKLEVRRQVLNEIGADRAVVFEAFAGEGHMYRGVWKDAKRHVGCDVKQFHDDRTMFVAKNQRVLRCLDLRPFNIFDLDSYGSPWEQAIIIAARRPISAGERIGLVLTEGCGLGTAMNRVPAALTELTGIPCGSAGLNVARTYMIDRALTSLMRRMGCAIEHRWEAASKVQSRMIYIGLVARGVKVAQPVEAEVQA